MAYSQNTNFQIDGAEIGRTLMTKDYLIDAYPQIADQFRFAGLWAWGSNNYGQLGINTITDRSSPVQTIVGGTNWKQISIAATDSYVSSAGIKTDGTLWAWGQNGYGQIGNNTIINRSSPVQITGTTWKQVSVGAKHVGAIKTDNTLWMWGDNAYGKSGRNIDSLTIGAYSSPVQVTGTTWKQVSCGQEHSAAIKTDGTLWTWGGNTYGELGFNDVAAKSSPVQITGTTWRQVSAGYFYTSAIKTDGTLWAWGANDYGVLGNNDATDRGGGGGGGDGGGGG